MNQRNYFQIQNAFYEIISQSEGVKTVDFAVFNYILHVFNKLRWQKQIGMTSTEVMPILHIGNRNTYKQSMYRLQEFGFIKIHAWGKNQFQQTVISLCVFEQPANNQSTTNEQPANNQRTTNEQPVNTSITSKSNKEIRNNKEELTQLPPHLQDLQFKSKNEDNSEIVGTWPKEWFDFLKTDQLYVEGILRKFGKDIREMKNLYGDIMAEAAVRGTKFSDFKHFRNFILVHFQKLTNTGIGKNTSSSPTGGATYEPPKKLLN